MALGRFASNKKYVIVLALLFVVQKFAHVLIAFTVSLVAVFCVQIKHGVSEKLQGCRLS